MRQLWWGHRARRVPTIIPVYQLDHLVDPVPCLPIYTVTHFIAPPLEILTTGTQTTTGVWFISDVHTYHIVYVCAEYYLFWQRRSYKSPRCY